MNLPNKFNIIIPPQDIANNKQCLLKIAGGDQKEFAWLYKNYSRKVFDYVMLMTQNEALSEDIVHDVFMRLWMHRAKLSTVENFNGYLYRLQKNLVIEILKRRRMELNVREQYALDNLTSSGDSFDALETKEKKACFRKCYHEVAATATGSIQVKQRRWMEAKEDCRCFEYFTIYSKMSFAKSGEVFTVEGAG